MTNFKQNLFYFIPNLHFHNSKLCFDVFFFFFVLSFFVLASLTKNSAKYWLANTASKLWCAFALPEGSNTYCIFSGWNWLPYQFKFNESNDSINVKNDTPLLSLLYPIQKTLIKKLKWTPHDQWPNI